MEIIIVLITRLSYSIVILASVLLQRVCMDYGYLPSGCERSQLLYGVRNCICFRFELYLYCIWIVFVCTSFACSQLLYGVCNSNWVRLQRSTFISTGPTYRRCFPRVDCIYCPAPRACLCMEGGFQGSKTAQEPFKLVPLHWARHKKSNSAFYNLCIFFINFRYTLHWR